MTGKPLKARINLAYANMRLFEIPRQNIAQLYCYSALRSFLAGMRTRL